VKILVTGAAGFIGSHLCEALLKLDYQVVGIDNLDAYYFPTIKRQNLTNLTNHPAFKFYELDLAQSNLTSAFAGVEVIFHLAARPGLLKSWTDFDGYMFANVQATQRILDATRNLDSLKQFLHISTSSIYGVEANDSEESIPHPVSPYGVTKLAAEHLCQSYQHNFNLPLTILRLFSVYGPRQRPDMGYYIFIEQIKNNQTIKVFGDGKQSRGNTFVLDVVQGLILAHQNFKPSSIYNIGGAEEVAALEVIGLLEEIMGKPAKLEFVPSRPGEQKRTMANITKAKKELGYNPVWGIRAGLQAQTEWQLSLGL
jgi:nucleoside-diphosphate-sugar epimerase